MTNNRNFTTKNLPDGSKPKGLRTPSPWQPPLGHCSRCDYYCPLGGSSENFKPPPPKKTLWLQLKPYDNTRRESANAYQRALTLVYKGRRKTTQIRKTAKTTLFPQEGPQTHSSNPTRTDPFDPLQRKPLLQNRLGLHLKRETHTN
ncbi:Hypothetical predicted protein [Pelobates cultripes]|uniref:Uncharacterized protein n=1 Tax=Pelobates cultripes TaxID=61616 RepID=A0AAD1T562_PELCU|nr:Hypothetical predicted protein [Pelobates cultripes]